MSRPTKGRRGSCGPDQLRFVVAHGRACMCICMCVCNGSKCRYAGTAADALSSQGRRPREAERGGADVLFKYRGAEPCALILGRTTLPDLFGDVHVDQRRRAWIGLRPLRPGWCGPIAPFNIRVPSELRAGAEARGDCSTINPGTSSLEVLFACWV